MLMVKKRALFFTFCISFYFFFAFFFFEKTFGFHLFCGESCPMRDVPCFFHITITSCGYRTNGIFIFILVTRTGS